MGAGYAGPKIKTGKGAVKNHSPRLFAVRMDFFLNIGRRIGRIEIALGFDQTEQGFTVGWENPLFFDILRQRDWSHTGL